jgi:hypothetical protein
VKRIGDDAKAAQCLRELTLAGNGDVAGTSSKRGRGTGRGNGASAARSGARSTTTSSKATAIAASTDKTNERHAGD